MTCSQGNLVLLTDLATKINEEHEAAEAMFRREQRRQAMYPECSKPNDWQTICCPICQSDETHLRNATMVKGPDGVGDALAVRFDCEHWHEFSVMYQSNHGRTETSIFGRHCCPAEDVVCHS